jgi:hypothetical protein
MAQAGPVGPMPSLPEQPSMYEVSRSLRLFLEAPRKVARGLRRASEAMGGAGELVQGLQDPRVRRNAMRGLYHTAAQHEAEGGPLAPVGPVVRAAVRFAEPVEDGQGEQQQSRRIQVRASVRKAPTPVATEGLEPAPRAPRQAPVAQPRASGDDAQTAHTPGRPEPIKRSISVRRVEPPEAAPAVAPEPPQPEPVRPAPISDLDPSRQPQRAAPVRRIAVGRVERAPVPEMSLVPDVRTQQNGVHRPDENE